VGFTQKRTLLCVGVLLATLVISLSVALGSSAAGTVGWTIAAVAEPTHFSAGDSAGCESEEKCDRYQILVANAGDTASTGPLTLTDKLPAGIRPTGVISGFNSEELTWNCATTEKAHEGCQAR
jgi:hypothetical protein